MMVKMDLLKIALEGREDILASTTGDYPVTLKLERLATPTVGCGECGRLPTYADFRSKPRYIKTINNWGGSADFYLMKCRCNCGHQNTMCAAVQEMHCCDTGEIGQLVNRFDWFVLRKSTGTSGFRDHPT